MMKATTSQGFLRPTTTPTPDEIFDVWLPVLSGAELKVLLYIVRRTFGFKKDADAISLSQICRGITTKEGRALDRGTGLSRTTAYKAVKQLEALGLITVRRNQAEDGSPTVNVYSLRFQAVGGGVGAAGEGNNDDQGGSGINPGVGQKLAQGGLETDPGVGRKDTPQQTVPQQTARQQTEPQQTAPPPEEAPLEQVPSGKSEKAGAGGAEAPDSHALDKQPAPLSPPGDVEEAVRRLVAFGVWRSRASRLVTALALTPESVTRAIEALDAEAAKGAAFTNPAAVLAGRLEAGWVPPEAEERPGEAGEVCVVSGSGDAAAQEPLLPPEPERKPLPPVRSRWGQEWDAHTWFAQMKHELQLQLPRETFDAWLHSSELVNYRPPGENEGGCVLIRLQNQNAYQWVTRRLHVVIQRLVSSMVAGEVEVEYTCPQLEDTQPLAPAAGEEAERTGWRRPRPPGCNPLYTSSVYQYIHPLLREVKT